jgi:uncharacterized protein
MGASSKGQSPSSIVPIRTKNPYFCTKLVISGNLMRTAILEHLSPFGKILFLLMLLMTCLILSLLLGILIAIPLFHVNLFTDLTWMTDFSNPVAVSLMKYLQIVQSVGLFIIPPLLAGYFFDLRPLSYLGLKKRPGVVILGVTLLLMVFSIPFIDWIVSMNESVKLPYFLRGIEEWMQSTEEQASELTNAFLEVNNAGGFLVNFLMIALLPAIGEELLFRGLLQKLFGQWFRNIHVAIFFTAFIFGLVHMQFYGIIPRMFLGVIFGYLFYWTGSLWVPVFAHFINNGTVVVVSFLSNTGILRTDYETFGSTENIFVISGSLLISVLLMYFIRRNNSQTIQEIKADQTNEDQHHI